MSDERATLTKAQAEQVLALVGEQFKSYLDPADPEYSKYGPKLYEPGHEGPYWVIWWEEGPSEWALRAFDGGFDEEVYHHAREFGEDKARAVATTPAVERPDWLFCEPQNSLCLALYPR